MPFTPFQKLIPHAASHYGISKEFQAIAVCSAFEAMIPELFPDNGEAKLQIKAKFYKNYILTIGVPSSSWASELMMRKHKILESLNQKFSEGSVKTKIKDVKTAIF